MAMENDIWSNMTKDNGSEVIEIWLNGTNSNDSAVNLTSANTTKVPLTEAELLLAFARLTYGEHYWINFPVTFVVCVMGLVTNSLNIVVFTRKHMINSVNFFLTALSVADIVMISSQIPYTVHYFFGFEAQFAYAWVQGYIFLIFWEAFGIMLCNWLAVTVGIWRFLAITWPLQARIWCSMSRAKKILIGLVIGGICISLPIFALLRVDAYHMYGKILYSKGYSDFAHIYDQIFLKIFWGGIMMICVVPCVLLVLVNILLVRNLLVFKAKRQMKFKEQSRTDLEQEQQTKKNYRTTAMLTIVLVLFVMNALPDSAMVMAAFFGNRNDSIKQKSKSATDFIRVFNMVNNAISFFVYYLMGENFRSTVKTIFCASYAAKHSPGKKFSIATNSTDMGSGTPRESYLAEVPLSVVQVSEKTREFLEVIKR